MKTNFNVWKTDRNMYLNIINGLTLEQLNKIPAGFNNNIIWNIGHVIVVQQLLTYKATNQAMYVSDELVNLYKTGTRPTNDVTQAEVDQLKALLISNTTQTENDYQKGIFTGYNELKLPTGFHIKTIEDAMEFNNYHEGMHLGYIMSIKKFI